jgi:hypothetical protein
VSAPPPGRPMAGKARRATRTELIPKGRGFMDESVSA